MLLMMHAKLRRPNSTADKEFYRIWAEEAEIGLQALEAGTIQQLYKIAGKNEVVGIFEIDNGDDLDGFVYNSRFV